MTVENHSYCVQQKTQSKYNCLSSAGQGAAWAEASRGKDFAVHGPKSRHTFDSPAPDCHNKEACTLKNSIYL